MRSAPRDTRSRRKPLALALAALAVLLILSEAFPKGFVVLSITRSHGIDAGDLPALALLLVAAWLAISR
jgi:hypothetical protein